MGVVYGFCVRALHTGHEPYDARNTWQHSTHTPTGPAAPSTHIGGSIGEYRSQGPHPLRPHTPAPQSTCHPPARAWAGYAHHRTSLPTPATLLHTVPQRHIHHKRGGYPCVQLLVPPHQARPLLARRSQPHRLHHHRQYHHHVMLRFAHQFATCTVHHPPQHPPQLPRSPHCWR